jgi:hypothetical protein
MQLSLVRAVQPRYRPNEIVPYSTEALRHDLERVHNAWADCQADRDRNAIYGYFGAVYGLVAVWAAEGREVERARRALRLRQLKVSDREDPFAAIIRCTADPAKADKRTRSKWSRVLRYAAAYKSASEPLDQFVRRKGGINACAARFSRCLGAARLARQSGGSPTDGLGDAALDFASCGHAAARAPRQRPWDGKRRQCAFLTTLCRCP